MPQRSTATIVRFALRGLLTLWQGRTTMSEEGESRVYGLSRRGFLGGLATGAIAPYVLTSHALGDEAGALLERIKDPDVVLERLGRVF